MVAQAIVDLIMLQLNNMLLLRFLRTNWVILRLKSSFVV